MEERHGYVGLPVTDLTELANSHGFNKDSMMAGNWTALINALSTAHNEGYNAGYRHGTETATSFHQSSE